MTLVIWSKKARGAHNRTFTASTFSRDSSLHDWWLYVGTPTCFLLLLALRGRQHHSWPDSFGTAAKAHGSNVTATRNSRHVQYTMAFYYKHQAARRTVNYGFKKSCVSWLNAFANKKNPDRGSLSNFLRARSRSFPDRVLRKMRPHSVHQVLPGIYMSRIEQP